MLLSVFWASLYVFRVSRTACSISLFAPLTALTTPAIAVTAINANPIGLFKNNALRAAPNPFTPPVNPDVASNAAASAFVRSPDATAAKIFWRVNSFSAFAASHVMVCSESLISFSAARLKSCSPVIVFVVAFAVARLASATACSIVASEHPFLAKTSATCCFVRPAELNARACCFALKSDTAAA